MHAIEANLHLPLKSKKTAGLNNTLRATPLTFFCGFMANSGLCNLHSFPLFNGCFWRVFSLVSSKVMQGNELSLRSSIYRLMEEGLAKEGFSRRSCRGLGQFLG